MAAHPKRIDVSLISKILTRKKKANVFLFIPDRKAIPKRPLVANPSAPEAELLVGICAIRIKRLMFEAFNHGLYHSRVLLRRSLADYSNDARHSILTLT